MFELMEIAEQVYEVIKYYKTTTKSDANCASHGRKRKGGKSASPIKTEKGRAGKRKKILLAI